MTHTFLTFCEDLAELYDARYCQPFRDECGEILNDSWCAFRFFVVGYAFERQGSSASYAAVVSDLVRDLSDEPLERYTATEIWDYFCDHVRDGERNPKNNPLCPHGTPYQSKEGEKRTAGLSVIQILAQEPRMARLVMWARQEIEATRVRNAHTALQKINGVGPKIASLFLRDVCTTYGLAPSNRRDLLQPVDTWVRRVAQLLSGGENLTDAECAALFLRHARRPEKANQGAWYFCAQVAGSSTYVLRKALCDSTSWDEMLNRHLAGLMLSGEAARRYYRQEEADQI